MAAKFNDAEFEKLTLFINSQRRGSFANFTQHYDGKRDANKIEAFLSALTEYKVKQNIDENTALNSLPLVLKDDAWTWWKSKSKEIKSWESFEKSLRETFKPKRENYMIFEEIFSTRQLDNVPTKVFLDEKRALLAEISPPIIDEEVQLDMLYGLLNDNIQKKVPRESFSLFSELFELAKAVEQVSTNNNSKTPAKKRRIRCNFCRMYGHTADLCRKKIKKEEEINAENARIYRALNICSRPTVNITVGGIDEIGFIDTGAGRSCASFKLYKALQENGYQFIDKPISYSLVDGIQKNEMLPTLTVPVTLKGRTIATNFMVFLKSEESKTLLGVDFLQDAGIVLNLPQLAWYFSDEPNVYYDLQEEDD